MDFSLRLRQKPGMRLSRLFLLLVPGLAFAGCGEAVKDDHFANQTQQARAEAPPVRSGPVPVRVGELGPNFDACGAAGTTRRLDPAAGETLEVRAAPFDSAAETGAVRAGTSFFVCTRSHDQRWLGIVYDESGTLAPGCGVSSPLRQRRNYQGPCRSGWVPAASVKLIAG